jgi:hypothetical protein
MRQTSWQKGMVDLPDDIRNQRETGRGWDEDMSPGNIPSNLLLLMRLCLLRFPEPSKIVPPSGGQAFNSRAYEDISYSNDTFLSPNGSCSSNAKFI